MRNKDSVDGLPAHKLREKNPEELILHTESIKIYTASFQEKKIGFLECIPHCNITDTGLLRQNTSFFRPLTDP